MGESDELLGDMDPKEMEVRWLHSPLVKIADAIENKTTVYKVSIYLSTSSWQLSHAQGSGKQSVPSAYLLWGGEV